MAVDKWGFSARAFHRVLKVARTIADLDQEESIHAPQVSEAIQYRMMDKYFKSRFSHPHDSHSFWHQFLAS